MRGEKKDTSAVKHKPVRNGCSGRPNEMKLINLMMLNLQACVDKVAGNLNISNH